MVHPVIEELKQELGDLADKAKLLKIATERIKQIPPLTLTEVLKVLAVGELTHSPNEWRRQSIDYHLDHFNEHMLDAHSKEDYIDKDSGLPSIAHAICRLIFVAEIMIEKQRG